MYRVQKRGTTNLELGGQSECLSAEMTYKLSPKGHSIFVCLLVCPGWIVGSGQHEVRKREQVQ